MGFIILFSYGFEFLTFWLWALVSHVVNESSGCCVGVPSFAMFESGVVSVSNAFEKGQFGLEFGAFACVPFSQG